jgi:hypothetical protein
MNDTKRIKFNRPILISQSDTLHLETMVWSATYAATVPLDTFRAAECADEAVRVWRERLEK